MASSSASDIPPGRFGATLSPFRYRIFFAVWFANMLGQFGNQLQSIAASWTMTSLSSSPQMVALVVSATTLPILLFSLISGALADIHDRRILLISAQVFMLVASTALAIVAYLDMVTPELLLLVTFLLGCGLALNGPSWQALVGELVPRSEVPAAVALNILGFNVARTLGPALGGIVVAAFGTTTAFTINAVSYIGLIVVLGGWKPPPRDSLLPPETLSAALAAGVRYVMHTPRIRSLLIRAVMFGFFAAATLALTPLIVRDHLGAGAAAFGALLACTGIGSIVGAALTTTLRNRYGTETIIRVATLVLVVSTTGVAIGRSIPLVAISLLLSGAATVVTMSSFNLTTQMSVPRWVVGRALSIYQMSFFAGMSIGSWIWGAIAERTSLEASLLIAAGGFLLSFVIGLKLVLTRADPDEFDLSGRALIYEPQVAPDDRDVPVVVTVEYRIPREQQAEFIALMQLRQRLRRRDGARRWRLLQDAFDPEIWVERFHARTWHDHLRRHSRSTREDAGIGDQIRALHIGDAPPVVHYRFERLPVAHVARHTPPTSLEF